MGMNREELARQLLEIVVALDEDGKLLHNFICLHQDLEQEKDKEKEKKITGGKWSCSLCHTTKSGVEGFLTCWTIYATEISDDLTESTSIGQGWRYEDARAMAEMRRLLIAIRNLFQKISTRNMKCDKIVVAGIPARRLLAIATSAGAVREDGTWKL